MKSKAVFTLFLVTALLIATFGSAFAQDNPQSLPLDEPLIEPSDIEVVTPYLSLHQLATRGGKELTGYLIHGPSTRPAGFEADAAAVELKGATLSDVPAYKWVYGCSAVSGSMIAAFYDRNGYPNMYTGPTNGGVMPLNNSVWGTWTDGKKTYPNNPLTASHKGVDGRTIDGSIDDYWYEYGSANDPYFTGSWTQHTWGTAIGDYMKTSHYQTYHMPDGSTSFYNWGKESGEKLTCADMDSLGVDQMDGTFGRKLFYEARGYTVTECFNQRTDNNCPTEGVCGNYTLANFQSSIDAGNPVLLNLAGHSIVGVGYSGSTIYIHDTWDYSNHAMTWGGTYSGMALQSVSIVQLASSISTIPTLKSPGGGITDTTPTYKWSRVTDATQYQLRAYKGDSTTPLYNKYMSSASCGATDCTSTPAAILDLAGYKWQARANVGGTWQAWSAKKSFTVKSPIAGWESTFSSNATGWTLLNGTWTVSDGYYQTAGLSDKYVSSMHDGTYGVFTFSATMERTGCSTCAQGIYFNGSPSPLSSDFSLWDKGYLFEITNSGFYSIWKLSGGNKSPILVGKSNSNIKPGVNTLKVTFNKDTNFVQFYVNGSKVASGTFPTYTSGQVGITMFQDSTSSLFVDSASLTMSAPSSSAASDGMLSSEEVIILEDDGAAFGSD